MTRERDAADGPDGGSGDTPADWPNRNTLWGGVIADEFAKGGVSAVCIAPGSRSTPLTVAFAAHPDIEVFSHLDERSMGFFALGRAKRTGEPTPVVTTSGTATANLHPAVVEANQARVPLVALTADRPPELRDSGANQTIDQQKLYGSAVRFYRDLPEPAADARKLRSLRVDAARALAASTGTPPGPVHLNVPFRKPLEPTPVPGDVPAGFEREAPLGVAGRDGPFVRVERGRPALDDAVERVGEALAADRALLVAGPTTTLDSTALAALADAAGAPVLADPLSGLRFGSHPGDVPVCGGYDSYLDASGWPKPDVVLRVGASPTSKVLRDYLRNGARSGTRQFVVDPAGGWREATFSATDLLVADPNRLARALAERVAERVTQTASDDWRERFAAAETRYWTLTGEAHDERFFEGTVLRDALADAPDPATVFVSNSMTVRDADRFAAPRAADLTVLGNRGASGIDGIVSTGLGAGSATDDPLVLLVGDLAYYHDTNGLLALSRCGVDATVVLVNNDGGGIFHMLPIADFDPPFSEQFVTPHGLDFAPTADRYGFEFVRADGRDAFRDAYRASVASAGTQVIEIGFDSGASHDFRETVHDRVLGAFESAAE